MGKGFGKLKAVFKKKKTQSDPKDTPCQTDEKADTPQSSADAGDKEDSAVIVIHNAATLQHVPIQQSPTTSIPAVQENPPVTPRECKVPSVATSPAIPSADAPPAASDQVETKSQIEEEEKVEEKGDKEEDDDLNFPEESLSINQVDVNPSTTEDISEYSDDSTSSISDEDEEVNKRVDAVLEAAENIQKDMDRKKGRSRSSRQKHPEDESVDFSESTKRKRRSQRQRRRRLSEESLESNTRSESVTSPSVNSIYSDELIENRHSYDTNESSSFHLGPAVENVKRGNEKSMHKDIMSHGPGGTSAMMVRAMYYVPLPREDGDVVIEVEASTVSFRDCLLRRGLGMYKAPFPFVPGCESVGIITSLGKMAKTHGFRVGDRVMAIHRHGGGNSKYARYNYNNLTPIPSDANAAHTVCLGETYMTAYQALRMGKKDGTPLTGSNILITDGFSPIGQAAIQLCKHEGANVYVTITDSHQQKYVESLGVKCLPFSPSKWLPKVKGMMDIVIDNTCFDSYESSWKALNKRGVLICTGMSSLYNLRDYSLGNECGCGVFGDTRDIEAKWMKMKAKYVMSQTKFYDLYDQFEKDSKIFEQELKYLCFLVAEGRIKPKISEQVTIEEVPDAQKYLETGKANGSIVCLP